MPFNANNTTLTFAGNLNFATWMKVNLCIYKNVLKCHRPAGPQLDKKRDYFYFLAEKPQKNERKNLYFCRRKNSEANYSGKWEV